MKNEDFQSFSLRLVFGKKSVRVLLLRYLCVYLQPSVIKRCCCSFLSTHFPHLAFVSVYKALLVPPVMTYTLPLPLCAILLVCVTF